VAKHLGVKQGLIYLPGMPQRYLEDSDLTQVFRQRRYFYYLSGVNFPDCTLTYNIQNDKITLFIPPPTTGINVIFNGSNPTKEEVAAKYDVDEILYTSSLTGYLNQFAHKEFGKIYALNDSQVPKGKIAQTITFRNGHQSNLYVSPIETSMLKNAMDASRVIKTPYEITLLRKANAISAIAHTNVLRGIKFLSNETEIEAIFIASCIAEQAKQQAYGVVAASGVNASTLHYMENNEDLNGRQLVCLDAGSEWECYASDVTRSFPINGTWSEEARAIYDIVAEMQESCIEMIKPGANMRDLHIHAHKVATLGLMELGILQNGEFEELYKSGITVAFFMHGVRSLDLESLKLC
jgi:Xaa-Pro dipeptidase